jgi:hypothetical protein
MNQRMTTVGVAFLNGSGSQMMIAPSPFESPLAIPGDTTFKSPLPTPY